MKVGVAWPRPRLAEVVPRILFRRRRAGEAVGQAKHVLQAGLDAGDLAIAQFVVKQFCPKPRGGLVVLDLPQITSAAALLEAQNLVLQAVARGEIATGDGQALMSMMLQIAKTLRLVAQEEENQALPDRAHPARSESCETADMSGPEVRDPEDEEVAPTPSPPPIDLAPFAALEVRSEAVLSSLAEPPPVERDQALPVPLGGRLVVAPALREGEAVMDAHVDLEFARVA